MDNAINSDDVGVKAIKDELSSIWSYQYDKDTDENNWKCRKTTSGGSWSTGHCTDVDVKLDTVVPGRGYWLNMDEPAQLKGFGTQIAQGNGPGIPPEIDVPKNSWALIGRYGILGHNGPYPGETCWDAGAIEKNTALESLSEMFNELHVFDVDSDAHLDEVYWLFDDEGYWAWVEDEAFFGEYGSYAPLDKYYREDIGPCRPTKPAP